MGEPTAIPLSVKLTMVLLAYSFGRKVSNWYLGSNCIGGVLILVIL